MGFKCYMSFRSASYVVVLVDLIGAVAVVVLCILSWQFLNVPSIYLHSRQPWESRQEFNEIIEACVTYWILTILLVMAGLRLVIAALLFGAIKRNSVGLAKGWIVLKLFCIIMALFLILASMTVGLYTRIAAAMELGFHVITVYHIKILVESFGDMERLYFVQKSDNNNI